MKIAASISRNSRAILGRKLIWASTSRSRLAPGRDLDQFEAVVVQPQHAALGDVEHGLAPLMGALAAEGHVPHLVDELPNPAVTANAQPPIADRNLGARSERPEEQDTARGLADIDETAGAWRPADRNG